MHAAPRSLVALLATSLLLGACSATAQAPHGSRPEWPQPRPEPKQPTGPVRWMQPTFEAPSAAHCHRPMDTREVPGWTGPSGALRDDRPAKSAPAELASRAEGGPATDRARAPAAAGASNGAAVQQPQGQQVPAPGPTTAGVVDDNADFAGYLAFRQRTRVAHRPRDVRDRYLLEVRDRAGRGVADAEVAVTGAAGAAMWARTDAGGRAWLHPDAFDPSRSAAYDIAVRKQGREASGRLVRGQRSAVEVVLDTAAPPARARLDLVFLVDATGSMGDEIDKLKSSLTAITGQIASLPSRPDLCLGLVAYRDRGDAFLLRRHDLTDDVGHFLRDALVPLQAAGGGDYPEAMNEALHETVHQVSWRGEGATRLVVLLADAPPHLDYGGPQYDEAMVAALGKGIKVFSVAASGLDKQGEFIQRQIAQYTGGRFVFLTYADARRPDSGAGRETVHDVRNYSVDTLDRLVVRLVADELGRLAGGG
jgi:Mg-chelatase subunit ChlD